MIKAVIFDMDGVLIDSEYLSDQYYLKVFENMGITPTFLEFESLRGANGHTFWSFFVDKYNIPYPTEEFKHQTRLGFIDFLKSQNVKSIPGIEKLLKELSTKDIKIALASSASNIRISEQLKLIKLSKYFKTIVSGEQVTHGKPNPEIYLKAAAKLGVDPINCIAIEDATSGVESAKKAHMKIVGYKSATNSQDLSKADIIVNSFTELSVEDIQSL